MNAIFRTGTLAIVGQPNVGKSTLVNRLVGQKVSITSRKPQTTRHRITGILTTAECQYIFVDTPGFQTRHPGALNRVMNRSVTQALSEVDVIICVIEAGRFGPADRAIIKLLPKDRPVLLAINKIDRVADKSRLLPFIAQVAQEFPFAEIVPLSAANGDGAADLLKTAAKYLPEAPPQFEADDITDRSERFLAGEIVREKLFRLTGDELPYNATVVIDNFVEEGNLRRIAATIVVEREAHKGMIIGEGGERLKRIGSEARQDLERLWGAKVFLELWVKVRSGWADDEAHLRSYGYE